MNVPDPSQTHIFTNREFVFRSSLHLLGIVHGAFFLNTLLSYPAYCGPLVPNTVHCQNVRSLKPSYCQWVYHPPCPTSLTYPNALISFTGLLSPAKLTFSFLKGYSSSSDCSSSPARPAASTNPNPVLPWGQQRPQGHAFSALHLGRGFHGQASGRSRPQD